jgi:hypothetical protein
MAITSLLTMVFAMVGSHIKDQGLHPSRATFAMNIRSLERSLSLRRTIIEKLIAIG